MRTKLAVGLILLIFSGCATTPRRTCFDANNTFTHTVNILTILIAQGKFDPEDVTKIKALVNSGDRLLDLWTEGVKAGDSMPNTVNAFYVILDELIAYQKGAGNGQK